MTYFELRRFISSSLKKSNIDEHETESLLILEYVSKLDAGSILSKYDEDVPVDIENQTLQITKLRKQRLPLSYITGKAVFFGYEFNVSEDVLIPRFDTEVLVEKALEYVKDGCKIADVCCGSGCIGVTIAKKTNAYVYLYDKSKGAIEITKKNIDYHNVGDRAIAIEKDVFSSDFYGENVFDYIISNPPYIETKELENLQPEVKKEPKIALDGGVDGLVFYNRILDISFNHLKENGKILFEIGYNQGSKLKEICEKRNLKCIIIKDYNKNDRVCVIENNA